jgi:hypothetical protein
MAIAVALVLSVMPLATLAASHHTATRTPVVFTSTVVEVLDPGEEWVDEAGIFHIRGSVQREDVTGDITGTAIVTFNVDFQSIGECTEESCFGYSTAWAHVEVTTEGGGWEGTYVSISQDVPGEEFFADSLVLQGYGANAGMSIVAQSIAGDEESITFEGVLSTIATPVVGLNTTVQLCADPNDFSFAGGFLSRGAVEGSGGATGEFLVAGTEWTHRYAVAGTVTLTDAYGTVTIAFTSGAQDVATFTTFASHVWGHFVIVDGSGAYTELYGHGRLVGTASDDATCASGFGVGLSLIGEAHFN